MSLTPRQSNWGLIGLLGVIVVVVLGLQHWPRQERVSTPARLADSSASKIARPRGLFAPVSPVGGAAETRSTSRGSAPTSAAAEPLGRELLRGRVVAPDGAAIRGAVLSLRSFTTSSDADGRFEINKGSGKLRIAHPNFFPRDVAIKGAEAMSLVLIPGVRLHGRVTNPDGRAITGATVEFGTNETPPRVTTNPQGEFTSPLLPQLPVCVLVLHPDYQAKSRVITFHKTAERWDVTLETGDQLLVVAQDEQGLPAPDAEVWMSTNPGPQDKRTGVSEWRFLGRTGDLGRLATRRPPGEVASVRLSLAGFRDETREVPHQGEVRVRLRPVPAWRGQAVDRRTGLPVRIGSIRLEAKQADRFVEIPHRGILFESLELGKFVVGLPPQAGTYRLHVRSRGSEESVRDLQSESEPIHFDGTTPPAHWIARLEERLELRGILQGPLGPLGPREQVAVELLADAPPEAILGVLDDGPERRWEVAGVSVPAPLRKLREGKTLESGRFHFAGLSHGTHRLRVRAEGFAEYLSAPFVVPWEGDFVVQLRRPATLAGTLHGKGGAPETGVPILLIYQEDWSRLTRTGSDGRFEFRQLGPGTGYRLVVGSAHPASVGAGHVMRALSIEEGVDVTYDLHLEEPAARPGDASPPEHPDRAEPSQASHVAGVAHDDDLVLAPTLVTATDEAGAPMPAVEGAEEPTQDLATEDSEPPPDPPQHPPEPPTATGAPARLELELFDVVTRNPLAEELEVEVTSKSTGKTWRGAVAAGRAAVEGLPAGKHRVRVRSQGLLLADEEIDVDGATEKSLPLEEPHEVAVPLRTLDGNPFRGQATVILRNAGREILRRVETINETLTLPTPGPGEYELTVDGDELFSRLRVRVSREIEAGPTDKD